MSLSQEPSEHAHDTLTEPNAITRDDNVGDDRDDYDDSDNDMRDINEDVEQVSSAGYLGGVEFAEASRMLFEAKCKVLHSISSPFSLYFFPLNDVMMLCVLLFCAPLFALVDALVDALVAVGDTVDGGAGPRAVER